MDRLQAAHKILKLAEAEYKSGRLKPVEGSFLYRHGHKKTCACAIGAAAHHVIMSHDPDKIIQRDNKYEAGFFVKEYKAAYVTQKNHLLSNATDYLLPEQRDNDVQATIITGFDDGFVGDPKNEDHEDDEVYRLAYNFGKRMKKAYG